MEGGEAKRGLGGAEWKGGLDGEQSKRREVAERGEEGTGIDIGRRGRRRKRREI